MGKDKRVILYSDFCTLLTIASKTTPKTYLLGIWDYINEISFVLVRDQTNLI